MTQIHACDVCPERDCENCYLNDADEADETEEES